MLSGWQLGARMIDLFRCVPFGLLFWVLLSLGM